MRQYVTAIASLSWQMKMKDWLKSITPSYAVALGAFGVVLVGTFDYLLDILLQYDFMLVPFYLVPVTFAAWTGRTRAGITVALFGGVTELATTYIGAHHRHSAEIYLINSVLALMVYVPTAHVVSEVRHVLEKERSASRTDPVTDIPNSRAFYEAAFQELVRMRRTFKPLTVVYFDIDNFKIVNDTFGHSAGDRLLKGVGQAVQRYLRGTDVVARLGGDEFGVLLVETDSEQARTAVERMRVAMAEAAERVGIPVSFSVGVRTFSAAPADVDEMMHATDQTMYQVKRESKNGVLYN